MRSSSVDQLVTAAFERTQPDITVVAVGGYGRSELFPYSDVDLLLLTGALPTPAQREPISEMLRQLWDAKLRISQSVHTPQECCEIQEGNLELTISLLDRRLLCGDPARFEQLQKLFPKFLNSERNNIIGHLGRMTRGRHAKYGDTIYHLEPNVKEHPGGLRDLHVIHWLQQLKTFETEPLDEPRAYLFDLRSRLHEHFGRDNNVLNFEAQEWISDDPGRWMRGYYRNAREIFRSLGRALEASEPVSAGLLSNFRDWRARLSNSEFTVSREKVLLRTPPLLETDPGIVMRLMQFIARHQLPLARDTEVRLAKVGPIECRWPDLKALLSLPRCVNAIRAMSDLGLLQRILPEWSRIDCLVVRDFYHRYTVDEHTLVTLQMIEELKNFKDTAHLRFSSLLSEIDRPALLRLALVLHDIGKGSGEDHATKSVVIGREAMARWGVPQEEQDVVLFLVERHIELSSVMTSRDLGDASTARKIVERTGTIERLKLLTLLTYADISAVNPTAMTPWRLEQLWQTYLVGHAEFTRELESDRIHAPEKTSVETAAFLEGLPTRYQKTHTPEQIAAHVEFARQGNAVQVARAGASYEATIVARDRPFLLVAISGALASFGMNILKAEAFTNSLGQTLDSFVFEDPHRTLELNPDELDRLKDTLLRAVLGKVDVAALMQKRRRTAVKKPIQPSVSFTNDVSDTSTLIEIVAEDRPGLMYDLTCAISSAGANIEVVLLDTEAHRALDVFYVTADGGKLSEERMEHLKAELIRAAH